ncbi:PREDICTED: substance-K receptor-like [Acropora digitifera]|uniref:substance-K receptor-like n=1 Tax=Acropora digitifera TaxID=70779 RepID=UPI00077A57AD|nr:PREDICTED: substance-K receptor-like [Acropora digitifera]
MSQKLSRVLILLTWLLPVVSSAPMFVANNVFEINGEVLCLEAWPSPYDPVKAPADYKIILFALFYVFPLTVISFLYSLVIFKIWRRRVPGNRSTVTTEAYSRSRRKALKVFISVVVCFALCWLPYHVTFFLMSYNEIYFYCGLPRDIAFIAVFFSHAISAFNPYIYLILNKEYRTGSKRLLYSCCCKDSSTLYPERSTGTTGHSRTGASELRTLTSVDIKSPRVRIARFRQIRVDPYHEDLSKGDAFVLPYRSARRNLNPKTVE